MTREEIKTFCLSLPGAELSVKWGDDTVFSIGLKMFVAHGSSGDSLSFKCSDDAFQMLTESGVATPAKYLARAKWVSMPMDAISKDELEQRLEMAYAIVRAKLTKKLQAELPAYQE